MCANKRKWQNRDEKYVKLGFMVYRRYYEINNYRSLPSYESFMKSKLYSAFTKFGRYLLHINAINMPDFIDFLIKSGMHIDNWEKAVVYENYVREQTKKETSDVAVHRNILLMEQWATQTGEPWYDFFRKITPELATLYICGGRISPWVLYTAASAECLFDRLSEEQIGLIRGYIDPQFWKIMFDRHADDVQFIKQELQQGGV